MNATKRVLGCILIGAGCLVIAVGMSVPEVTGATPNDTCCTPARVDQPSSPGGCTPCDDCMSCHADGCDGQASGVAIDGSCDSSEGDTCNMGTGTRVVVHGIFVCDEEAYPDCECTFSAIGNSTTVQVQDCSGDHC